LTYHSSKDVGRRTSQEEEVENHGKLHQILISYVRAEAAQHALDLKKALTDIGYTVYLVRLVMYCRALSTASVTTGTSNAVAV
jgi:hypothetical protein